MLLDRTATANAKPELEIFADDVKCAHGCAVGELDKQALFYMASRGMDPATKRKRCCCAPSSRACSMASPAKPSEDRFEAAALAKLEGMA
jgi:Fe-S cluster assembly protein SufD